MSGSDYRLWRAAEVLEELAGSLYSMTLMAHNVPAGQHAFDWMQKPGFGDLVWVSHANFVTPAIRKVGYYEGSWSYLGDFEDPDFGCWTCGEKPWECEHTPELIAELRAEDDRGEEFDRQRGLPIFPRARDYGRRFNGSEVHYIRCLDGEHISWTNVSLVRIPGTWDESQLMQYDRQECCGVIGFGHRTDCPTWSREDRRDLEQSDHRDQRFKERLRAVE